MIVHRGLKDDIKAVMKRGAWQLSNLRKQNDSGVILGLCIVLGMILLVVVSTYNLMLNGKL